MNTKELLKELAASLQQINDIELFGSMIEFCQGEMRVLLYLHMNIGNEIYPSDLSEELCVTRQRITSILSSLRKKGFINMEVAERDRRRMKVVLTDYANNWIVAKKEGIETHFFELIEGLGERNTIELTRLINLCIEQLKKI